MTDAYPDEIAGPYEKPTRSFTDKEGRSITVETYDGDPGPLVEMYQHFDPEDRAQGIPPTKPKQIRRWLENVLEDDCVNVVAYHDETPIGHAMLVPDEKGGSELAIFVLREYQGAGIGTELIKGLLGAGREAGIDRVWLTVERWNTPAIALYRNVGFVSTKNENFELEMSARLLEKSES